MKEKMSSAPINPAKGFESLTITKKDCGILRELARKVAEIAARPIEFEKRELWYKHNSLQPTRPLIFCDPENGWNEIITPDSLQCEGPSARFWEFSLRKEIFWGEEMQDDRVIEPYFNVPHVYSDSGWYPSPIFEGGENGGSYTWKPALESYSDLEKIKYPQITVDYEATERNLAIAQDILGDILQVRLKTTWWWSFGLTGTLIHFLGIERMLFDMVDNPEGLHRLMSILRDGYIAKIEYLEQNSLLSLNNDGTYVGSGGFGWTNELPADDFEGKVRAKDMWGFSESQETIGVSPEMFEEFVFQYQLPLLEKFGLNCYGCCEAVDSRWKVIEKIPRLRRVSVSPWSNIPVMAEKLEDKYIFSMKPNPADLAAPSFDEERIRKSLRSAIKATGNCRLEIIMKDNHTIRRDPDRVKRWVRIAKEEAGAL